MTDAEAQVERFRHGEVFQAPAPPSLTEHGGPPDADLQFLGAALEREDGRVREQIVRLLADVGARADPFYLEGGHLTRDPRIVWLLATAGLKSQDLGREASLQALQDLAPPPFLQPHQAALTEDLQRWPGSSALLVIAKAKPAQAFPVVKRLIGTPRWSREQSARVAFAALGNSPAEQEFVQPFLKATDGKEQARLAKVLGWVGTEGALNALASQMRSPLVVVLPGAFERSVRVDIIAALRYNFPDQPVLFDSYVQNDLGYEDVERFCRKMFGVDWSQPRPPYLKIQGYPFPR